MLTSRTYVSISFGMRWRATLVQILETRPLSWNVCAVLDTRGFTLITHKRAMAFPYNPLAQRTLPSRWSLFRRWPRVIRSPVVSFTSWNPFFRICDPITGVHKVQWKDMLNKWCWNAGRNWSHSFLIGLDTMYRCKWWLKYYV